MADETLNPLNPNSPGPGPKAAPRPGSSDDLPASVISGSVAALPPRERLLSLDVFRGATIAGMLLVNTPGTWSAVYPPLLHAPWHGWTPTDLIFPFFLFIVGITTHLSLSARAARGADENDLRRQVLRRGAVIFLLGLLLSGFPFYTWTAVPGVADPSFLDRVVDRLLNWRIMGVLQRIGLAYVIAALLTLRGSLRQHVVVAATILLGYWFVMMAIPTPDTGLVGQAAIADPARTMAAWVDRMVLDWRGAGLGNHIWAVTGTWDPEGVLSTLPAASTVMLGIFAGRWIAGGAPLAVRLNGLFAAGSLAMLVGLVWNWSFPINKGIWTSSYVVFTCGMAAVALATIMWLVDVHRLRRWTGPLVVYGMNPIVAFVGSGMMARLMYSVIRVEHEGASVPLQSLIYNTAFAPWFEPRTASLVFALAFVLLWYGILVVLHRRGIFLKV